MSKPAYTALVLSLFCAAFVIGVKLAEAQEPSPPPNRPAPPVSPVSPISPITYRVFLPEVWR